MVEKGTNPFRANLTIWGSLDKSNILLWQSADTKHFVAPLRGADLGWVAYPRVALPFGRLPGVTTVRPFGSFTIDSQEVVGKTMLISSIASKLAAVVKIIIYLGQINN